MEAETLNYETPDIASAESFLHKIGGPGSKFCFATIPNSAECKERNKRADGKLKTRKFYGTVGEHAPKLERLNRKGWGIYFVPADTGGATWNDTDVQNVRALFVDQDAGGVELVRSKAPHIIVETSENRFHSYWRVGPGFPITEVKPLQESMVFQFDGDPKCTNPASLMRLPGFVNPKHDNEFLVRVIEASDHAALTVDSAKQLFGEIPQQKKLSKPLADSLGEGERHPSLFSLAGAMRRKGCTENEILPALEAMNEKRCCPPLDQDELEKMARGVTRYAPGIDRFCPTESWAAEHLSYTFGAGVRYDHTSGRWLLWDGTRWQPDETNAVYQVALDAAREIRMLVTTEMSKEQSGVIMKFAWGLESYAKTKAVLALTASRPEIATTHRDLDKNPDLFNLKNGTLDFTGKKVLFRKQNKNDLLTKRSEASYVPGADCPKWKAFTEWASCDDPEMVRFLRQFWGLCLTGRPVQFVWFLFGQGANGKSVFWNALLKFLGEYGQVAPVEMLLSKEQRASVPNDMARLPGAHLAVCSEIPAGSRLNEQQLKDLTGGDRITARFMRQEWFEFEPSHKLVMCGNHRPQVRGQDHAIWRRLLLIPFDNLVTDNQRRDMDEMLAEFQGEWPGILNWALEGLEDYWKNGLVVPGRAKAAIESYRDDEDVLGDFFREHIVKAPGSVCDGVDLFERYSKTDSKAMGRKNFYKAVEERGVRVSNTNGLRGKRFDGIRLAPEEEGGTDLLTN